MWLNYEKIFFSYIVIYLRMGSQDICNMKNKSRYYWNHVKGPKKKISYLIQK